MTKKATAFNPIMHGLLAVTIASLNSPCMAHSRSRRAPDGIHERPLRTGAKRKRPDIIKIRGTTSAAKVNQLICRGIEDRVRTGLTSRRRTACREVEATSNSRPPYRNPSLSA